MQFVTEIKLKKKTRKPGLIVLGSSIKTMIFESSNYLYTLLLKEVALTMLNDFKSILLLMDYISNESESTLDTIL